MFIFFHVSIFVLQSVYVCFLLRKEKLLKLFQQLDLYKDDVRLPAQVCVGVRYRQWILVCVCVFFNAVCGYIVCSVWVYSMQCVCDVCACVRACVKTCFVHV